MAFINKGEEEEPNLDREIPRVRSQMSLAKILPFGALLIGVVIIYMRHSGDDDSVSSNPDIQEKRVFPKTEDLDWGKLYPGTVEQVKEDSPDSVVPDKSYVEEHHEDEGIDKNSGILQPFSTRSSQNKTNPNETKQDYQNQERSNEATNANADSAAYIKSATDALADYGKPPPEKTFNESLQTQQADTSFAIRQENLDKKMLQGKVIHAIRDSAISTDLAGMVRAMIEKDVYSEDGKRLIFPAGSMAIGQYKGGMAMGIRRLFVIWTRIKGRNGLDIKIDSPVTDTLGRSGIEMDIDSHFWERFGSSVMLSVISAGVSIAGGMVTDGNQQAVQGIQGNFNKSAELALEYSLKIKPTGYAGHGENIIIFLARDLDFTNVFKD